MTYTPTTREVRKAYAQLMHGWDEENVRYVEETEAEQEFDNWLAEELRKAKAQALEEAAEAWENGTVDYFEIKHSSDAPLGWSDESVADAVMSSGPVMDWLRKRAKQIKDQQ